MRAVKRKQPRCACAARSAVGRRREQRLVVDAATAAPGAATPSRSTVGAPRRGALLRRDARRHARRPAGGRLACRGASAAGCTPCATLRGVAGGAAHALVRGGRRRRRRRPGVGGRCRCSASLGAGGRSSLPLRQAPRAKAPSCPPRTGCPSTCTRSCRPAAPAASSSTRRSPPPPRRRRVPALAHGSAACSATTSPTSSTPAIDPTRRAAAADGAPRRAPLALVSINRARWEEFAPRHRRPRRPRRGGGGGEAAAQRARARGRV